jgi:hypothetical protein
LIADQVFLYLTATTFEIAMINRNKLDKWFGPDAIPGRDVPQVVDLRSQAKSFAQAILDSSPSCADQSHAIRLVRDSLHSAAQAIVLHEKE